MPPLSPWTGLEPPRIAGAPPGLSAEDLLAVAQTGTRAAPAVASGAGGAVEAVNGLAARERVAEPGAPLEWVQAPDGRLALPAPLRPGQLFAVAGACRLAGGVRVSVLHPVPAARLRVSLLGGLTLRSTPSRQVLHHGPFPTRALELMTLLALRSVDGPASRAELAEALWPADAPASRKQNLKQVLRRVRKRWESETGDAGGAPFVALPGGMLRAVPDRFSCDISEAVLADRLALSLQDAGDYDGALHAAAAAFAGVLETPQPSVSPADVERMPWLDEGRRRLRAAVSSLAGIVMSAPQAPESLQLEALRCALAHEPASPRVAALAVRAAAAASVHAAWRVYEASYVPSCSDPAPFGMIAGMEGAS